MLLTSVLFCCFRKNYKFRFIGLFGSFPSSSCRWFYANFKLKLFLFVWMWHVLDILFEYSSFGLIFVTNKKTKKETLNTNSNRSQMQIYRLSEDWIHSKQKFSSLNSIQVSITCFFTVVSCYHGKSPVNGEKWPLRLWVNVGTWPECGAVDDDDNMNWKTWWNLS